MKDKEILWVILVAILLWIAAWNHEFTAKLVLKAVKPIMDLFK